VDLMTDDLHDPDAISVLDDDACWALLERNEYGHLAYAAAGEPGIVPINYAAVDGRIYFRSAGGTKLMGMVLNGAVVFEVDEISEDAAETVIVRGRARKLNEAEEDAADSLPIHPWVPTHKYNVVVIDPDQVTGRHFRLVRRTDS
jgi:nitroimidazol reductase NimA-like FMN-containing flavoprotein (pyridoxamine 5'-phosphate oxidase superfamily)